VNKKQGLIVAGVLVVAYAATSWTLGRVVHRSFDGLEGTLAAKFPLVTVAKREYSPGIFSSTETLTLQLASSTLRTMSLPVSDDEDGETLPHVTVRNRITHGPLPGLSLPGLARIESTLILDEPERSEVAELIGRRDLLTLETLLGFTGSGRMHLSSPAVEIKKDGNNVSWQGIDGRFKYDRGLSAMSCDVTAPGLNTLIEGEQPLQFGKMQLRCDMKRAFDAFYIGTVDFRIASLAAKKGSDEVHMQDIHISGDSKQSGEYVDMASSFGVGTLQLPTNIAMNNVQYEFALNHLHGPTYAALTTKLQDARTAQLAGDSMDPLFMLSLLAEDGIKLLEHSPEIIIRKIGFAMSEGEANLTGSIKLKDFTQDDLNSGLPQLALLQKVEATADIWIDEALLTRNWSGTSPADTANVRSQIAQVEQMGYITRTGNRLSSHLEFKQGKPLVNGKPVPGLF
jgi:uncharacterized protein YdgA (DUF945 family)